MRCQVVALTYDEEDASSDAWHEGMSYCNGDKGISHQHPWMVLRTPSTYSTFHCLPRQVGLSRWAEFPFDPVSQLHVWVEILALGWRYSMRSKSMRHVLWLVQLIDLGHQPASAANLEAAHAMERVRYSVDMIVYLAIECSMKVNWYIGPAFEEMAFGYPENEPGIGSHIGRKDLLRLIHWQNRTLAMAGTSCFEDRSST